MNNLDNRFNDLKQKVYDLGIRTKTLLEDWDNLMLGLDDLLIEINEIKRKIDEGEVKYKNALPADLYKRIKSFCRFLRIEGNHLYMEYRDIILEEYPLYKTIPKMLETFKLLPSKLNITDFEDFDFCKRCMSYSQIEFLRQSLKNEEDIMRLDDFDLFIYSPWNLLLEGRKKFEEAYTGSRKKRYSFRQKEQELKNRKIVEHYTNKRKALLNDFRKHLSTIKFLTYQLNKAICEITTKKKTYINIKIIKLFFNTYYLDKIEKKIGKKETKMTKKTDKRFMELSISILQHPFEDEANLEWDNILKPFDVIKKEWEDFCNNEFGPTRNAYLAAVYAFGGIGKERVRFFRITYKLIPIIAKLIKFIKFWIIAWFLFFILYYIIYIIIGVAALIIL